MRPASIGPPETKTVGMFSRMAAISMPGVILSQFDMQTIASTLCALTHVLDAVGDQVARRQRVEHAVVTHGDAVVDGDRVEFGGEAAFAFDPLLDLLPDLVKVHMPGHELRKRVDDGNHRLAYLLVFHSVRSP